MSDFLKRAIEAWEQSFGPLPKLTDAQLKQAADEIAAKAKAMRPIVTSCSHNEPLYQEGEDWRCGWCGQIVHPDPEGLKYGFREFGRRKP